MKYYSLSPGLPMIGWISNSCLWKKYPYMTGVNFEEIGHNIEIDERKEEEELKARKADEERKEDEEYNKYKEEFEKDFERMNLEDDEERYREERYGIQLEKFKDVCCRD